MIIRFLAVIAIVLIFWLGTRAMKVVPGRFQSAVEMALDFVRVSIVEDLLGKKDGRGSSRWSPPCSSRSSR